MLKTTVFVGLNDKMSLRQEINTARAVSIVSTLLIAHGVNGATISPAKGVYKMDNNGAVIVENTLRIEIVNPAVNLLTGAIISIKKALNQESVLVENTDITSDFI